MDYKLSSDGPCLQVSITASDIIQMVRETVTIIKLHHNGFNPDLVGAHSLWAGGAVALIKLHGFTDTTTIIK